MSSEESKPREEGKNAFRNGIPLIHNPYSYESTYDEDKAKHWEEGWKDEWFVQLKSSNPSERVQQEPSEESQGQPVPTPPRTDGRKLAIDRPCSACSAGDYEMKYHDHYPPFRAEPAALAPPDEAQIKEHDRIYPPRRADEMAAGFLRRSILEHRQSHESWIEPLRNNPGEATGATYGMAYQVRAVKRYDEMLRALDELTVKTCAEGAVAEPPLANFVSEVTPRPDGPSCHVCGAQMTVKEWKCPSCGATTGCGGAEPPLTAKDWLRIKYPAIDGNKFVSLDGTLHPAYEVLAEFHEAAGKQESRSPDIHAKAFYHECEKGSGKYIMLLDDVDATLQTLLKPLKDACDRDWKDETPEQIVAIAANAIYWRGKQESPLPLEELWEEYGATRAWSNSARSAALSFAQFVRQREARGVESPSASPSEEK